MKRLFNSIALAFAFFFTSMQIQAAVSIQTTKGWFESGYVTWTVTSGQTYTVYIRPQGGSYTQIDNELVRNYGSYGRADMVGLKAGSYQFKVVSSNGDEAESDVFTATAHDRSGFAHVGMNGIGAYKNDGTLMDGTKVLYVNANNAKTISTSVKNGSKDTNIATYTGLQTIIDAYQKGYDKTPLDIRIVGTIKAADMDKFSSSAEGLQVKGKSVYTDMPITIEGIGDDAAIWGFGILCRNCKGTEFRNFAIMLCMDDCLSLDTGNSNVWIHNMDFFYGKTGGDADQAKGDGTVDIKGKSMNCTVSYNHFFDAGKCSLGGMKGETTDCWMTYHHNWFDHSDSRHPRIRTAFYHVYNNYFDGVAKYGIGCTSGGSSFVEQNYFRNCKYPMLISKQGTDAEGDGTFSGEDGGVIKAYDNIIINAKKVQYYDGSQTNGKWDAVKVESRGDAVNATAYSGGTPYNSAADNAARTTYIENKIDKKEDVALACRGELSGREGLGAGRIDGGDFKWTFKYDVQDANYNVIKELKSALESYKSTLVGNFTGETNINNGGATSKVDLGDGKGLTQSIGEDTPLPSWGGGSPTGGGSTGGEEAGEALVIGTTTDYFWFNASNETAANEYISNGVITMDAGSAFKPTVKVVDSSNVSYSDKEGSLQLAKSTGYATFYNKDGISRIDFYLARTGSMKGEIQGSNDGSSFTKIDSYEGTKGTKELSVSLSTVYNYVRITNAATGSLHIQGIRLYAPDGEGTGDDDDPYVDDGDDNNPEDPDGPEDPDKEDPDAPTDPDQPVDPSDPDQPITPEDPDKKAEAQICYFTVASKSASCSMVTVSGNYSDSKGKVSYDGTDYSDCVKMESATEITIVPDADYTVTFIFGGTTAAAGKAIKVDGEKVTLDSNGQYSFDVKKGETHKLTKGDSINLFLIIFTPKEKGEEPTDPTDPTDPEEIDPTDPAVSIQGVSVANGSAVKYSLNGSRTNNLSKGQIYIVNGKKHINK